MNESAVRDLTLGTFAADVWGKRSPGREVDVLGGVAGEFEIPPECARHTSPCPWFGARRGCGHFDRMPACWGWHSTIRILINDAVMENVTAVLLH